MQKQFINPPGGAPPIGPYSPGLRIGQMVFVSGQGPGNAEGNIQGETISEQTEVTLNNIKRILESAGLGMKDVVKATVYLANLQHFKEFNEVYKQYFPGIKPTRTTVGCDLLGGILVEIDVIAIASE